MSVCCHLKEVRNGRRLSKAIDLRQTQVGIEAERLGNTATWRPKSVKSWTSSPHFISGGQVLCNMYGHPLSKESPFGSLRRAKHGHVESITLYYYLGILMGIARRIRPSACSKADACWNATLHMCMASQAVESHNLAAILKCRPIERREGQAVQRSTCGLKCS